MNKNFVLSVLLMCPFLLTSCVKNISITTPAYAIGTVYYYDDGSTLFGPPGLPAINYSFIVNGEEYSNNYTSGNWGAKWVIPSGHYKKGDMFMVEYDAGCVNSGKCNKGEESRILVNYPVKDSADYNNYVTQFATTPPTP